MAASLASSSSSPSERNGQAALATNQLIMHRYKAKSSQLQSPVSAKRTIANDVHYAQPGTSKDSSSGENESSTPKSGRKWKKTRPGKQNSASGGASSALLGGSNSNSTPSATGSATGITTPQNVLGIRLADCVTSSPDDVS
ncbi:hypothetical protein DICVIV_04009 [Dictyocaulus viviparus]|uniref:Uncharacterized protein n=1 Tax=Dictyocaulus viviparus TaxID=29172 RepID=A0A0D8XZD3_DICVI|nr:hypothetical protein DICVIV_04009 [Dictyocaulus viviparus]